MTGTMIAMAATLGTLLLSSAYAMATTAIRKRVTVRSPEARAIEQLVPTVNALLEMQGPQTSALIAILEAQKGICNGNVDAALEVTRAAHARFNNFLVDSARVQP